MTKFQTPQMRSFWMLQTDSFLIDEQVEFAGLYVKCIIDFLFYFNIKL